MFTKNLNLELRAWAQAGMRDAIGPFTPENNPGPDTETTGVLPVRKRARSRNYGKQLRLFEL